MLHEEGPLLVLAGAGSGKTRVLTYRIAYLVYSGQLKPHEILAITFTNKAAGEMRERVTGLVGGVGRAMWVSTFHSVCARILRGDAERLGYRPGFSIYDQQDQVRLVKHCLEELNFDPRRFPPQGIHARISDAKNRLVGVEEYGADRDGKGRATSSARTLTEVAAAAYRLYQKRLYEANAMDFDDLIMRTVDLFTLFPDRLQHYRHAFRHVLVDEYQDTNHAQYVLVRMLAEEHQQVTVVGDDDQSVYSWRGADIRNILEFERDFPNASVVKLEQNYRSTTTILDAANAVVAHNRGRKAKRLWSDRGAGEKVALLECRDEHEEARRVADEIEGLMGRGYNLADMAVFYRVNAQSRVLEDMLVRYGVPYQVVGGTKFYERAEIKDLLAYLRATVNPRDDISLLRILNTPRRGVGAVAEARLQQHAFQEGASLRQTLALSDDISGLTPAACRAFQNLSSCFATWETRAMLGREVPEQSASREGKGARELVGAQVEKVLEESGLLEALRNEKTLEAEGRLENLQEFVGVAREYDRNNPDGSLIEFLQEISLYADADSIREGEPQLTLMTLHNAKGLEYRVVFIVGMEEGMLPHSRSLDGQNVEEERRLCYVGFTRAMDLLYLSYAASRSLYGAASSNLPSRFLEEIPSALLRYCDGGRGLPTRSLQGRRLAAGTPSAWAARPRQHSGPSSPVPVQGAGEAGTDGQVFRVGDKVLHAKFGEGVVLNVEPGGVVRVFFAQLGEQKNLLLEYAPLRRL